MVQDNDEISFMREQQANEIDSNPNAIYADNLREEKVNNILGQINPDKLVIDIENRIRGRRKNPYTQEWEDVSETKKVSEELVADLVSYLGAFLNDNTTLSNYSEVEINNLMENVIEYLRDTLADNDEKYGLKGNYHEMTRIAHIICQEVFAVLKRALHGQESRRIFSALRVTESLNSQQNKRGVFDTVQFWK